MNFLDFVNKFKNFKIAFIGLGVSHINTVKLFKKYGLNVSVYDSADENYIGKDIIDDIKECKINIFLGKEFNKFIDNDIIFRTPGMDFYHPLLQECIKQSKIVTSEMEVFFDLCPCKIIGITGSDGKTTTTTIISEILKNAKYNVFTGGNIGKPLLCDIDKINKEDICVVELSSFQLMSMRKSPHISVITNITENHLDFHKTMQEYTDCKSNIFLHQTAFDKLILNSEDDYTNTFIKNARSQIYFSNINNENYLNSSFCNNKGDIYYIDKNKHKHFIINKKDIKIKGEHNVKNYLSAITAVFELVSVEDIVFVMKNFNGVKHRMEFVKTINKINFYNDSIASTPTRLQAGLKLFDEKIILIAGGYDKNLSFDEVSDNIIQKVKAIILIGQNKEKIKNCILNNKNYNEKNIEIIFCENLEDATKKAFLIAKENDNIVLCPASASFDMYKNFEKRGEHFKQIIERLQ